MFARHVRFTPESGHGSRYFLGAERLVCSSIARSALSQAPAGPRHQTATSEIPAGRPFSIGQQVGRQHVLLAKCRSALQEAKAATSLQGKSDHTEDRLLQASVPLLPQEAIPAAAIQRRTPAGEVVERAGHMATERTAVMVSLVLRAVVEVAVEQAGRPMQQTHIDREHRLAGG